MYIIDRVPILIFKSSLYTVREKPTRAFTQIISSALIYKQRLSQVKANRRPSALSCDAVDRRHRSQLDVAVELFFGRRIAETCQVLSRLPGTRTNYYSIQSLQSAVYYNYTAILNEFMMHTFA